MAATARQIPVSQKDLEGNGGGAYGSIEVPGDYEVVLAQVEDYDYTSKGKSSGWIFTYDCETPLGGKVEFRVYLSFGENARWKLVETLTAHGCDLSEGLNAVDPNALVGDVVGAHIDFPRDKEDNPTSKYREIRQLFSLVEEPVSEVVETALAGLPETLANATQREYDPAVDGEKFGAEPPAPI